MFKLLRQETTVPSVSEKIAANSSDFRRNITFVEVITGFATALTTAASNGIYGFVQRQPSVFASDNQTVAKATVSVQSDWQNLEFEYLAASAQSIALIGTYTNLATAETLTLTTGVDFLITGVDADEAGALKKIKFRIANVQGLHDALV